MTIAEKLEGFDALVLIHPDYGREWYINPNQEYARNIAAAAQQFWQAGRPVFVYPHRDSWKERVPAISRAIVIPARNYIVVKLGDHDEEARFIAASIGKEPRQVRLAVGGLLARGCVATWLQYWCREVLLGLEYTYQELDAEVQSSHLLGYGAVIQELTDIGKASRLYPLHKVLNRV